ncbi:hypothetical protein C477_10593 [Haloterrigena salina JCM 13891]|uniref:Uncharacterized protein n=1 Tax=Haloterrigena salina JCM 13891 TaxID=1227488 RepID=M0C7C7_9EURY|nr:hypothetical protein [Haloterrigena salina]ELZ18508.1 hypothetical protein C477_10593 [Haloterrigena salina JCM 13891]
MKYCLECDWVADPGSETDALDDERSKAALEHFVETGHSIDSSDSVGRPTTPAICEAFLVRDLVGSFGQSV